MHLPCIGMRDAAGRACLTPVRWAYCTNLARATGPDQTAGRRSAIIVGPDGPPGALRLEPMNLTTQRRSGAAARGR